MHIATFLLRKSNIFRLSSLSKHFSFGRKKKKKHHPKRQQHPIVTENVPKKC